MNGCYPLPTLTTTSRVVCRCLGVTEDAIIEALTTRPISTLRELRACTGAGGGCMCCHRRLQALIDEHVPAEDGLRVSLPAAG